MVGVAYKAGIADIRESPALDILKELNELGAESWWYDPYVEELPPLLQAKHLLELDAPFLSDVDCAVITTAHGDVAHTVFVQHCKSVVDTRNALHGEKAEHLYRL